MACLLDGVKCEGRVGMSIFGTLFGKSEANESGGEIEIEDRNQLEVIYKLLIRPFFGKGRGLIESDITYKYALNGETLKKATLSKIVEGIEEFERRPKNTNVLQANNPSIKIKSYPVEQGNIVNDEAVKKDKPVKNFINILNEFKEFILTLKDKTFKEKPVMETSLGNLFIYIPKYTATTPKRQKFASDPFKATDPDQATDPAEASNGGRRTKRHHTKRHHRTKRHHTKRVKRSKRTHRRKH
jgi:hypothetical protein